MLDDLNVIKQRDPRRSFEAFEGSLSWLESSIRLSNPDHDGRHISECLVIGDQYAELAARLMQTAIGEDNRVSYSSILPTFANSSTLVLLMGNSSELAACYQMARRRQCQTAVVSAQAELISQASNDNVAHVHYQPVAGLPLSDVAVLLRAGAALCSNFGFVKLADIDNRSYGQLKKSVVRWHTAVPMYENYAKQTALLTVGKTPIFYDGHKTTGLGQYFAACWHEIAKNLAFSQSYPDSAQTAQLSSWLSHPIEKPFLPLDIIATNDLKTQNMMENVDRLLSGRRPKAHQIQTSGDSRLEELLWGCYFAIANAYYVALLNNVRPEASNIATKLNRLAN